MDYLSSKHSKHKLGYHIIFCPKYRHQVFNDKVSLEVKQVLAQTCAANDWKLHSIEVMPDHVHLFVQLSPCDMLSSVVQCLKSVSAVYIFTKYPALKKQKFWGSGLWSKGTFYATIGSTSEEAIKRYIQEQRSSNIVSEANGGKNNSSPQTS
jgi:putative transposase